MIAPMFVCFLILFLYFCFHPIVDFITYSFNKKSISKRKDTCYIVYRDRKRFFNLFGKVVRQYLYEYGVKAPLMKWSLDKHIAYGWGGKVSAQVYADNYGGKVLKISRKKKSTDSKLHSFDVRLNNYTRVSVEKELEDDSFPYEEVKGKDKG